MVIAKVLSTNNSPTSHNASVFIVPFIPASSLTIYISPILSNLLLLS